MNNIMKLVFGLVLTVVSSLSMAQCVPPNGEYRNPYSGFMENAPRIYDSARRCYVPAGTQQQQQDGGGQYGQQWLARQAIPIPAGGIQQGYCSWDERMKNVGFSTILGGIFGALVGDNGRDAGRGAALGLFLGTMVPCAAQDRYLQQGQQGQSGERYQGGNTVRSPASCIVGGEDFGDASEATCEKIRRMKTANGPAKVTFSNESTGAGVCRLLSDGNARLRSNPSQPLSRGTVLAISQNSAENADAVVMEQQDGEDCSAWRRRAAKVVVWM